MEQLVGPASEPEADPGPALRGSLRPYQREGVAWLWPLARLGLGGCLADDMHHQRHRSESAAGTVDIVLATAVIAVASAVLLVRFRITSTWLVRGGPALGWVMHAARGG